MLYTLQMFDPQHLPLPQVEDDTFCIFRLDRSTRLEVRLSTNENDQSYAHLRVLYDVPNTDLPHMQSFIVIPDAPSDMVYDVGTLPVLYTHSTPQALQGMMKKAFRMACGDHARQMLEAFFALVRWRARALTLKGLCHLAMMDQEQLCFVGNRSYETHMFIDDPRLNQRAYHALRFLRVWQNRFLMPVMSDSSIPFARHGQHLEFDFSQDPASLHEKLADETQARAFLSAI